MVLLLFKFVCIISFNNLKYITWETLCEGKQKNYPHVFSDGNSSRRAQKNRPLVFLCCCVGGFMIFEIPSDVLTIIDVLENHGHKAYIVGGCIRDMLLGIKPEDYDICTSAHPKQVQKLFEKSIPTGIAHGTVTVFVDNKPFEVTTFRVESIYTDRRHPDNVFFSNSLVEDLQRRDFTINAMAYHPKQGIIDPFDGSGDIKKGIIRTVGHPKERFDEDALRMLRAIRFQSRFNFSIEEKTLNAIETLSENIKDISRERILLELNGIMLSPYPECLGKIFTTGLYSYIFPTNFPCIPDLTYLKKTPEELASRWAAFFKLTGLEDIEDIRLNCSSLKMSNNLKRDILGISKLINKPLPNNYFLLRKALSDFGQDLFTYALDIMKVLENNKEDIIKIEKSLREILTEKHCISFSNMAINGTDLISTGFKPGKKLGDILSTLFIFVLQNPELNQKDNLLLFAKIIDQKY